MNHLPFRQPGRFFKGNLHTHSTRSDGALEPEAVVATYREHSYDFLALTDHFLAPFNFPITDTRAFRDASFMTLLGAELHAPETEHGEFWHLLAVGLPLDFAPPKDHETGPMLAARAAEAGAFVGIAHPAWYTLTLADALSIDAAHAVAAHLYGVEIKYVHITHLSAEEMAEGEMGAVICETPDNRDDRMRITLAPDGAERRLCRERGWELWSEDSEHWTVSDHLKIIFGPSRQKQAGGWNSIRRVRAAYEWSAEFANDDANWRAITAVAEALLALVTPIIGGSGRLLGPGVHRLIAEALREPAA